jgi:hypothetical protein
MLCSVRGADSVTTAVLLKGDVLAKEMRVRRIVWGQTLLSVYVRPPQNAVLFVGRALISHAAHHYFLKIKKGLSS